MWTAENRPRYNRDTLRNPSDLTDEEWAHIEPLIPPGKRGGGKRRVNLREVVNGVMYISALAASGAVFPKTCPPEAPCNYFSLWTWDRTLDRIHHALYLKCRRARSEPHCLHHRQPEREKRRKRGACIDPPGFDAGKLIKGKKRHVLVDTQGLLLHGIVTAADVQDRDGGLTLLASLFGLFPFLRKLFADSAYQGPIFHRALAPHLEPRSSNPRVTGVVLPKRWIVERSIAWLNRCRRLAKDWENLNRNALGFLKLASIRLMSENSVGAS